MGSKLTAWSFLTGTMLGDSSCQLMMSVFVEQLVAFQGLLSLYKGHNNPHKKYFLAKHIQQMESRE